MAINKKLVHFKTFAKFNEELSAGNILDTSICWIKDTKQIWTHGQFYDCSSLTDEDIVGTALVGYTESVETNENLDLTAEDTIVGAFGKLVKAIKDNEEVDSAAFVKLRDSVGLDENLGFSTSAGDASVTEAIERIDGRIISSGDGSKFLADNGQYLAASGAVNITEIFKRISDLAGGVEGTCTDEDYNTLKSYADNGVTTYANMDGASMQVNILYMNSMILIRFDIFDGSQNTAQQIQIASDRTVNYIYNSFLAVSVAGDGSLGSYVKRSSYSAIAATDSISEAIGKLEANVEKMTVSGDGSKFLADDGQYKEVGTPIEEVDSSTGTITQELSPNKYYKFGRCTSLTIALGTEVSGILNEYMFEFISDATPTVLNLPETVKWNNGNTPTIEANKKYIVSIVSNIAVIGGA